MTIFSHYMLLNTYSYLYIGFHRQVEKLEIQNFYTFSHENNYILSSGHICL